jgi:hypothetical protein
MRSIGYALACAGLAVASLALADPPAPAAAEASAAAAAPVPATPPAPAAAPGGASTIVATPATPATPATAATPAAPVAATITTSAPAKTATIGNVDLEEQREKHFRKEGYTPEMLNGEKIYCRTDTSTGSRIPKKHCYAEDTLVRAENLAPAQTPPHGGCQQMGGCNGG